MRQVLSALAVALAVAASPAAAQRGIAVEVRGGAGVGNYAGAGAEFELAPQPSFGAAVSYALRPAVEVYAGYSRTEFGCDGGFCAGRGMTFTSSGVDAGVRLSLPVAAAPWVRLGVVSHTLDFASSSGEPRSGESSSGVGFEAGGGVEARLGSRLSVTPGVRYARYGDDTVAMVVGDVGMRIRF
jgi:outer membrane autotransporter protein